MSDIISFFAQYENALYFILALGLVGYGVKFYRNWRELRGSIYGLEQINAQRRLNNSAIAMFLLVLMGFLIFSLITFVGPGVFQGELAVINSAEAQDLPGFGLEQPEQDSALADDTLATATPLPTVAVDPAACITDIEEVNKINISSPRPNQEVHGLVEVTGIVDVENFGFYKLEIARVQDGLWLPIQANRVLVPEDAALVEWDSSLFPPGDYVLQLVVTTNDGDEYPPCRIPIRIGEAN